MAIRIAGRSVIRVRTKRIVHGVEFEDCSFAFKSGSSGTDPADAVRAASKQRYHETLVRPGIRSARHGVRRSHPAHETSATPRPMWPPGICRPSASTRASDWRGASVIRSSKARLGRRCAGAAQSSQQPGRQALFPSDPLVAYRMSSSSLVLSLVSYPAVLHQPRKPHRQLRIDHFEFAPGQLHVACSQGHIVSLSPLGLNHHSRPPARADFAPGNPSRECQPRPRPADAPPGCGEESAFRFRSGGEGTSACSASFIRLRSCSFPQAGSAMSARLSMPGRLAAW